MLQYNRGDVLHCIYVDVLIVLNWYINYFILLGTAKITHIGFKRKRLVMSSFIGALSSLMILLPTMHYLINVALKLIISLILILVAFGIKELSTTLKMSLYFCVISFLFAGVMMALKGILNSEVISTNNSYVYANFSIKFLIISTTISYGLLCLLRFFMDKNTNTSGEWLLTIIYNGKSVEIKGLADTGNSLVDTFTGKPVVVCSKVSLQNVINIPSLEDIGSLKGFRLIPYSTISNGGIIISFVPDKVTITNLSSGRSKDIDVLIGVSGDCSQAIFNPKILV